MIRPRAADALWGVPATFRVVPELFRHENCIDDVNHAIRLIGIADGGGQDSKGPFGIQRVVDDGLGLKQAGAADLGVCA